MDFDSKTGSVFTERLRNIACIFAWATLSIAVILYNKWILSFSGFPYPITLTAWHMLFCSSASSVLLHLGVVPKSEGVTAQTYLRRVLPIAVFQALTLWFGNSAYLHLSVALIQMLKALMPVGVYCAGALYGMRPYETAKLMHLLNVCFGAAMVVSGEVRVDVKGITFQLLSIACESTRLCLVENMVQHDKVKFDPITSLYYVAPASCMALLFIWSFLEAKSVLPVLLGEGFLTAYGSHFLLNAVVAFSLNVSIFLLIGRTSALTLNLSGVGKDLVLIAFAAVFHGQTINMSNVLGYAVCIVSILNYNRG